MSKSKIRVGIVGLSAKGGWAATAHIPALRALGERYEITGLSASSAESAAAAAEKFEIPFHTADVMELAARPDVDLLTITVKVPHHLELATAAIKAGKAVYCEWPLGATVEEAESLAALAKEHGVRNFVGLQARSAPALRYLKDLIAEGAIGEVLSTSVIGSGGPPWGGSATSGSVYATDRSTGASMLTIPFGHTFDGLRWSLSNFKNIKSTLATRRPEVTLTDTGGTAIASSPDQIAIAGVLENGAVASMHYRGGISRGTNFLWEINGTDGDIVVSGGIGHLQFGLVKLQAAYGGDSALTELVIPDSYKQVDLPSNSMGYTVAHAYHAVYDDMSGGSHTVPDFDEAVRLHKLLAEIERD